MMQPTCPYADKRSMCSPDDVKRLRCYGGAHSCYQARGEIDEDLRSFRTCQLFAQPGVQHVVYACEQPCQWGTRGMSGFGDRTETLVVLAAMLCVFTPSGTGQPTEPT